MVKAYDTIWIIGDNFILRSATQHFLDSAIEKIRLGYIRENFEVKMYVSNQYNSMNTSILSRLVNCLVKAISENYLLPRIILFVIDNDILESVHFNKYGTSVLLGILMEWLFNQMYRAIKAYKEFLPKKALRQEYPQLIWIEPPLHKNFADNDRRKKFASALNITAKLYEECTVLQLRKIWETDNVNLYLGAQQRYTVEGYTKYWLAVDNMIKLWDTFLRLKKAKKDGKQLKVDNKLANVSSVLPVSAYAEHSDTFEENINMPPAVRVKKVVHGVKPLVHRGIPFRTGRNDKFHWSKRKSSPVAHKHLFYKLPTPPPRSSRTLPEQ